MIPVVRVLVERAAARREALLGLAGVVPADYWNRTAPGEAWTAYTHLAHALSADAAVAAFIGGPEPGTGPVELDIDALSAMRERALSAAAALSSPALLAYGVASRTSVVAQLATLSAIDLDRDLAIGGRVDAWGRSPGLSLYAYLEEWAGHDSLHESAIRAAVSTPPDLSAATYARRLR